MWVNSFVSCVFQISWASWPAENLPFFLPGWDPISLDYVTDPFTRGLCRYWLVPHMKCSLCPFGWASHTRFSKKFFLSRTHHKIKTICTVVLPNYVLVKRRQVLSVFILLTALPLKVRTLTKKCFTKFLRGQLEPDNN